MRTGSLHDLGIPKAALAITATLKEWGLQEWARMTLALQPDIAVAGVSR